MSGQADRLVREFTLSVDAFSASALREGVKNRDSALSGRPRAQERPLHLGGTRAPRGFVGQGSEGRAKILLGSIFPQLQALG